MGDISIILNIFVKDKLSNIYNIELIRYITLLDELKSELLKNLTKHNIEDSFNEKYPMFKEYLSISEEINKATQKRSIDINKCKTMIDYFEQHAILSNHNGIDIHFALKKIIDSIDQ